MDAAATGMPADAPGAAPPYVSPSAAFPIAIVIGIGFMVTSLILVSYYLLVVRCWLRANGPSLLPRARRDQLADRVSAVFFTDHDDAGGLPGGVDLDVVAALPVVAYRPAAKKALECAVCLSDFAPGERLKMLPACSHVFHIDCIDTWLHHNISCPLCRTEVTGPAPAAAVVSCDDHDEIAARDRRIHAAHSTYAGGSCRFPKQGVAVQEPIRRSLSMDFFPGDRGGRKPSKEAQLPSHADVAGSSSSIAATNPAGLGETSGRLRRLLSSFGLGRSSRSTVLPINLDP